LKDVGIKIVQLKYLKQGDKESVREYMNRYEACAEIVENYYPKDNTKAKKKALAIEEYKKEKNYKYEDQPASEDTLYSNKLDIDIDKFTEASFKSPSEYLKVKMADDDVSYNLRLVDKKKKDDNLEKKYLYRQPRLIVTL
ncbi:28410_t:CDS:2, partial [Racocetra persica]